MKNLMIRSISTLAIAASLAFGTSAVEGNTAQAQEIQLTGPLAGAPAVEKLRQYRKGRFELAPSVTFTLLDEYRRTILFGARLQYGLTDWLGLGVWGGFGAVSMSTDLSDQIQSLAPRNSRTVNNRSKDFTTQTAKLQWTAAPQITLVPFRGKISLFQKLFLDTDAYIHGGVAFVGLSERANCGTGQCGTDVFKMESRMAIAPTFGLGLNFYLPFSKGLMSLGLEYRAMPFAWNRGGIDSQGGGPSGKSPDDKITEDDRTFKFNQMMSILIGFSLPSAPGISTRAPAAQ